MAYLWYKHSLKSLLSVRIIKGENVSKNKTLPITTNSTEDLNITCSVVITDAF